jgi:hypothetical protein
MRLILAATAAAAVAAAGLAVAPASAAGSVGPVTGVTVTPSVGNDGTGYVDVSWAGEPPDADGALVCLHRGKTAIQSPSSCESQVPVEAPGTRSGAITIHPGKNYVIEVFAYKSSSPVTYSTPVSKVRHGIKVAMNSHCNGQSAGDTCTIVGTVTDAYTGSSLGKRKLELWQSREKQPAKWTLVAARTTASTGVAHVKITLDKTHLYQWHYPAPRTRELPSNSQRVDILVS